MWTLQATCAFLVGLCDIETNTFFEKQLKALPKLLP